MHRKQQRRLECWSSRLAGGLDVGVGVGVGEDDCRDHLTQKEAQPMHVEIRGWTVRRSSPDTASAGTLVGVFWLAVLWLATALAARPAAALTPIGSADLSTDITVTLDSQTIADEDVASDELVSGTITKIPLGSLPQASDVSAYHAFGGGKYLLSFDTIVTLPGGVTAFAGDVVQYDGSSYAIKFNASTESVPEGVHTDAVTVTAGGNLVLSFDTTVALGGSTYADEDLVEFDGLSFSSFFDGSAAGLAETLDIDGAHVLEGSGNLALSFDTSGSIGGVDFDDEDVLEFDPSGPNWEMAWDTSVERTEWKTGADVDAVFVPEPGQSLMLATGSILLAWLRSCRQRRSPRTSTLVDAAVRV